MKIFGLPVTFDIMALMLILLFTALGFLVLGLIVSKIIKKSYEYTLGKMTSFAITEFLFLAIIECIVPSGTAKTISFVITIILALISVFCWTYRKKRHDAKKQK